MPIDPDQLPEPDDPTPDHDDADESDSWETVVPEDELPGNDD